MLIARRVATALGIASVAAAVVLMLLPLHAAGVHGNAFRPHYTGYGWYSYVSLPAHPRHADFVRAGITVPQDVVHDRRVLSAAVAGGGAVLLLLSAAVLRSRKSRD